LPAAPLPLLASCSSCGVKTTGTTHARVNDDRGVNEGDQHRRTRYARGPSFIAISLLLRASAATMTATDSSEIGSDSWVWPLSSSRLFRDSRTRFTRSSMLDRAPECIILFRPSTRQAKKGNNDD
jgi:hypothetical protein